MEKEKYILEEKKEEFNKVFIKKAEELDEKIEDLWKEIIPEKKIVNIFKDGENFEITSNDFKFNKFDNDDDEVIFQFIEGDNYDFMNFLKIKENGTINYNLLYSYLDKDENYEMLDPITDREWEEDIEFTVSELVERQLNYLKEKRNFFIFSEKYGKGIFNKYYSHIKNKIDKEISYIEKAIEEIGDMK